MLNFILRIIDKMKFFLMNPEEYARSIGVKIGKDCRILNKIWGSEPFLITIGDRVTVTGSVTFLTHDGSTWLVRNNTNQRFYKYGEIVIGSDAFIGANVTIMPGIVIGSKVIVGAGSVVTKNIPDNSVVAGNPAKLICSFDIYKQKIINTQPCEVDLLNSNNFEDKVYKAIKFSNERLK